MKLRVAPGASAVGLEETAKARVVRTAEAERDAGAIVVVVDRASLGGSGGAREPRFRTPI